MRFTFLAAGLVATACGASAALAQEASEDEIVVTAQRPPGSVPGDAVAELTLNAAEIRSYATSTVSELIGALSAQTGSASGRGGGQPIILVNGRRISGFQEVRDLPSEAIARVEVFNEQVAAQYGFAPTQRVINLVLRRFYTVNTVEIGAGDAAGGARGVGELRASRVVLDRGDRLALSGDIDTATAISEAERGLGGALGAARTLAPRSATGSAAASLSKLLDARTSWTASLRYEASDSASLLGLDSGGALITREGVNENLRAAVSLDGGQDGWQWTTNAVAAFNAQRSDTHSLAPPRANRADTASLELNANANGPLFSLPAGAARATVRVGLDRRSIDARSPDGAGGLQETSVERTGAATRIGLNAPLTSIGKDVGAMFGDLSVNAALTAEDLSDAGGLFGYGAGVSWGPLEDVRFSLQYEQAQAAPSAGQLGDPVVSTPGVSAFDPVTGQSVRITRLTGGLAGLAKETRQDWTATAQWSPRELRGFGLNFNWARNRTEDAIAALPTGLAEAEAAFPGRYVRNSAGGLTQIDARPVNLAERETQTIRWGVSFSQSFGTPAPRPAGASGPPWGAALPPWGSGPPPWGSGPPPWERDRQAGGEANRQAGGGGFRGGGGGPPPGGRWNAAVFHVVRLSDEVVLAPGAPALDLTKSGGLSGDGEAEHSLELEGGIVYRGLGLRMNGAWSGARTIRSGGGDLEVEPRLTLTVRAISAFDQQPDVLAAAPWLRGGRLAFSVQNLTDEGPVVRDAAGLTPDAFAQARLAPAGRVVRVSFRKQF